MMIKVLDKVSSLSFDLRRISELATSTQGCIRSDLGELNYPVAPEVYQLMEQMSRQEDFGYAATLGDASLLAALHQFEANTLQHFEAGEILVTSGGQAALFAILSGVMEAGKSILTDQAYYPPYKNLAQLVDAQLDCRDLSTLKDEGLANIQVVLLNSPSNPTGQIYDQSTLEHIATLAQQYNWLVVEDAVYNQIYFDTPPLSIAQFCPERTLVINSASKNFCMPGTRIGWIMGESSLVKDIAKVHRNMNSCPNTFFQKVLGQYIPQSNTFFAGLRAEMQKRRDKMIEIFDNLHWSVIIPQGGIYCFVTIPTMSDSFAFVEDMIQTIGVSAIPGELFGAHPQQLRFCYGAMTMADISELEIRLKQFALCSI